VRLQDKDSTFRKSYLRHFVTRIVVADDEIRIEGPKTALMEQAAKDDYESPSGVRTFEQEWCTRPDSNL